MAARDARDATSSLKRFCSWCIGWSGWWSWRWELSWIATIHIGALQLNKLNVQGWSEPIFEAFLGGAWILHWTEDTLYWIAKPQVHTELMGEVRRLHNDRYAALESDHENIYFVHGVMVPAFVVVKPEWITIKHIQQETNAEVRRVMMDRYGLSRFLGDSGAKLLGSDELGELYRTEIDGDEPLVMVKVLNSTEEPDGTRKPYFLRVPPTIEKPRDAVAWTFGYENADQYVKALVQES